MPELLTHGQDRRVGHHRARLGLRRVRLDGVRRPVATATSTSSTDRRRSSPTAPTPTRSCSSASSTRATRRPSARCSRSSSTRGCPVSSSRSRCARWACTRRRPASSSSTTCGSARDRLIGETEDVAAGGREGAKATFMQERSGVAAMALGIIEECLDLSRPVRQGPGAVRPAHRRVPAHPGQARPHGGGPPQRREPRVPHRRDVGRRAGP